MSPTSPTLSDLAKRVRRQVVTLSHKGKAPHLGSALSCVDILVAAYFGALRLDPAQPLDPKRDRFLLSKGHAAAALYAVLAERGFISDELLATYNRDGGVLAEHPTPGAAPGIEAATGSLGHGLPLGVGMAVAGRLQGHDYRVVVVMSDGECNEGSVWEAAMFAAAQRLDHLVAVVDYNKWQATGRSDEILQLAPLADKFRAFGWNAEDIDGHAVDDIAARLRAVPSGNGRPTALVAHTVKGRGVSFMEDDNNWHYRVPDEDAWRAALAELA